MQIQLFHLSIAAEQGEIDQVNRFLTSHKSVKLDKQFVDAARRSNERLRPVRGKTYQPRAERSGDSRAAPP